MKIFTEHKEFFAAIGFALLAMVRKWFKNAFLPWLKNKLVTFISSIGDNWKTWLIIKAFRRFAFPTTTKIEAMLNDLLRAYDMDRVILFYFHNPNSEMYPSVGYDKFSSFRESRRKGIVERHSRNQNLPMESMADEFDILFERGQIYVFCSENKQDNNGFFHSVMNKLNVKSSYNEVFKGDSGKFEVLLVMNSEANCKPVDNFEMFRQYGRIMAGDFYVVRPRK